MSELTKPIDFAPTAGLSYDPTEDAYWRADALDQEVVRAFEICHGCRMCFKYCESFPTLFKLVDDTHDGDVRKLDRVERERVFDLCFQCKLCEVQCPYTPRDGHAFQLDFPKLVHRFQAQRAKEQGIALSERVLGDPDRAGAQARASLGLVNTLNRSALHRWFLEKVLDVHRDKLLPEFAGSTFEKLARAAGRIRNDVGGEAVLFQTCYVQHNEPEIGRDTLEVFAENGIDLRCAAGLVCCGMPKWEHGDLEGLRAKARINLDVLEPFVEKSIPVIAINPTCSMMLRREWPELLEGRDRERAERLAPLVRDPCEFLWAQREDPRFNTHVRSRPTGPIAYHAPCHLRAQAVGFKARELFKKLLGVQVLPVLECCGHDGTWAMTTAGYESSQKTGRAAFAGMREAGASTWSTDCPLAAIQFEQHAGTKPLHPMTILARAYRGDPFEDAPPGAQVAP